MSQPATVTLQPINALNWRACADLEVQEHQRSWLPSNLESIAVAQFYTDSCCRVVYADDELVGFCMYGVEQNTNRVKVFRLMIGSAFQRRGYGTAAMVVMLHDIARRWPSTEIYVSYQVQNVVAERLYTRMGFSPVEKSAGKVTACRRFGTRT